MTTSGANLYQIAHGLRVPRCPVCGGPKWQKHLETCPGPPKKPSDA